MNNKSSQTESFSFFKRHFWPIHNHEIKKFLPLNFMMFFILFNYTILRNMKDTLVITTSGPEIIPFLKAFVILPFSVIIVATYTKLSHHFSQQKVFYIILSTFLLLYVVYAIFIYPNREALHMSPESLHRLRVKYPNFQHFFAVIANWSTTIFYLFAELWGATMLGLMFWRLANEITKTKEASRFYAMYNLISHVAVIFAGYIGQYLCCNSKDWQYVMNYQIILITISGIIICFIHAWINKNILPKQTKILEKSNLKKKQPSILKSFEEIIKSKYIRYMAIMVIGYGAVVNITGIIWKKQVLLLFPNPLEYSNAISQFSIILGILTIFITFFCKGLVVKVGWYKTAMVTPVVVLVTSILFFIFMFFNKYFGVALVNGSNILMITVLIGAVQQILGKGSKYCIFDPTKEMAYIPLSHSLRSKGKAAIDVTGYSFAKASGGYITGSLLVLTAVGDLMVLAPYLAVIVMFIIGIWIVAVKKLSVLYQNKLKSKNNS